MTEGAAMVDCVDHNHTDELGACEGVVSLYASLSGSGESYPRCERHYRLYVERVQPQIDAIRRDYPDTDQPPDWFDPTYAGERWNEDD
ncbi:hypothetical protein PBI_WINKY_128 [Mycobacterium phage Winky]|uniref:Uncharacterized protein n=1 Tax=Mycobacterium phage Faith1 TaxID=2920893 RepID=F6M8A9_9CAUD|nr:hypothetical protein SEA_FAITH1_126 [Mycobacterium phage Faith1]AGK87679.1 hypothetical protein PBI_WINKY_128 [Mycobacterium phage Winky]AGM12725.1 hypothetical protein PBI_BREEZONA_128 [Mycobacterium phage Breezona]AYN57160.1 hypothetical protein PBI_BIGCHEESE_127 [Mycobacterium phage BigCheese]QGZ17074.1 hypothetical protein PBI_ITOS_128 [Mycobacterium phage Itos]QYW01012.1 hypothetical protein SEA_DRSEEGS_126 [Mycobacterium phage DrSeegs]